MSDPLWRKPFLSHRGLVWALMPFVMFRTTWWCSRWYPVSFKSFCWAHPLWGCVDDFTARAAAGPPRCFQRDTQLVLPACMQAWPKQSWQQLWCHCGAQWQQRWPWHEPLWLWQGSLQRPAAGLLAETREQLSNTCSAIPEKDMFI